MNVRSIARRTIWTAAQIPALRTILFALYDRKRGEGWRREHPFDQAHGIRTSGWIRGFLIKPGDSMDAGSTTYGATQPSILRRALADAIPNPRSCHFIDLGCGKGRPLFVAAEFAFASITGVEFSCDLARIARRNAKQYARAHPEAPKIEIVTGDATQYRFPDGNLVVYMYNPFLRPLTSAVLTNLEVLQRERAGDIYIVYYNPAFFDLFDASAQFERRYAAQIPYSAEEIGCGPDDSDAVVVWQNRGNTHPLPSGTPNAKLEPSTRGPCRVEIATTAAVDA